MRHLNQNRLEDSEQTAWIILNAAKFLSVGKHKLAEFLKGSKAKDIAHLSIHQGYGGLLWHDIATIIGFIEQLERMEFLRRTQPAIEDYYSVLEVTEAGRKILDEKIKIGLQIIKNEKRIIVGDSEKITFGLFKAGKSIEEIAKERNLAVSTIYGHLHRLIANGYISSSEVVSQEVIRRVEEAAGKSTDINSLKEIKELLPDVSYEEIRCALADRKNTKED
ncbi:helix-turn-helix domain-containing protein [Candidatus Woesearchaeota archaeon]|nr:helix-turn-helix domain-containing protein [Candidatus Woesearchaeota archaeon]